MRHHTLTALFTLAALAGCKTTPPPAASAPSEKLRAFEQAVAATLDPAADPCVDFYQYACGGWLKTNTIPSDKPTISRGFTVIADENEKFLHAVLERAAAAPGDDENLARVGAVYGACMDTDTIDARGAKPLEPLFAKIDAITDGASLMEALAALQWVGVNAPFGVGVGPDFKAPEGNILHVGSAGIGLPDRDFYLLDDKAPIRDAYRDHVKAMFVLLGHAEADAAKHADALLAFETEIAKITLPIVERRDPDKTYNKLDRDGLQALTPSLPWDRFFAAQGYADLTSINVSEPAFFAGVEALWATQPAAAWHRYLKWRTLDTFAGALSSDLVAQNFAFKGKVLSGAQEDRPRWKKCVSLVDDSLGDALGQVYVDAKFAGDSKELALSMIADVEASLARGFADLDWMDDATRAAAKEKMSAIDNKIGYPDMWRSYDGVKVDGADHFANTLALNAFDARFWMDQAEKPVDRGLWYMSAPTVNAYYNPLGNEIVFPAGIMQPPFFDREFPKAMNYGAMGMVMGHEVTHGFDDEGRKFDARGHLREWWAPEVAARFEERAQCVRDLYSGMEILPGVPMDGDLTAGENIADLGGLKHAWGAYQAWQAAHPAESLAGLSGDKLFFVAYAQSWCTLRTPEYETMLAAVDPHSAPPLRVNGAVSQLPVFGQVFGCDVGSPMRPKAVCEVW